MFPTHILLHGAAGPSASTDRAVIFAGVWIAFCTALLWGFVGLVLRFQNRDDRPPPYKTPAEGSPDPARGWYIAGYVALLAFLIAVSVAGVAGVSLA
jgi:hypothetical protein